MINEVGDKWRFQKNGQLKSSVLTPILFNLYTNDQQTSTEIRLAFTAQDITFNAVENDLTITLQVMTTYYINNQLKQK